MNARFFTLLLLATGAMALPTGARAQGFSFAFGNGYGHHGHHGCHGGYGGWYGFDFYRPPPVTYVYPLGPPPVTYIYPAPAVVGVAQAQPQPSPVLARSAPRTNSMPVMERSDVTLHNPAENAGNVAFLVQEQTDAELRPGGTRTWSDRASLTVDFDRGGSFGTARKVLQPGNYDFIVTDQGWDLVATVSSGSPATAKTTHVQRNTLPARR